MNSYHYTESGLDTVYLANGFTFVNSPGGQEVIIEDVEGLHTAIGVALATQEHRLSGKDVRFLRLELLLSQSMLAQILKVKPLTVVRWEKEEPSIPVASETLLRAIYLESVEHKGHDRPHIRVLLEKLADLEDELDTCLLRFKKNKKEHGKWEPDLPIAA